jgi:Heparinase II/III-like protein
MGSTGGTSFILALRHHFAKTAAEADSAMSPNENLLPLNPAEAIFAPFHDPFLADLVPFAFLPGNAVNGRSVPFWCWTMLQWDHCTPGTIAGTLELNTRIPGRPYDRLILCLTMPSGLSAQLHLPFEDGAWKPEGAAWQGNNERQEISFTLPAGGAAGLRVEFTASEPGAMAVGLAWFGVQNSTLLGQIERQRCRRDPGWPGWIKPESEWTLDRTHCGLLFDGPQWEAFRQKKNVPAWRETWALLQERAERALAYAPEEVVGDFLPWQDHRYIRMREHGRPALYLDGPVLAFVGVVNRDGRMVRHALRCLLSIIHARSWTCSEECRVPGSTWDTRCFLEEMYSTAATLMFDWLASALTDRARELFATRLWDNGLAVIERDLAKFEYVHHVNQGPWFGRGRLLAGLVLETLWPRMGDQPDRALKDLVGDLGGYLLPDGGADEGPMYHALTLEVTLVPIIAYARRRGLEAQSLLPEPLKRMGDYYRALASGRPGFFIPDGDCANDEIIADNMPILARLFPDGRFDDLLAVSLPRRRPFTYIQHYGGTGLFSFILGPTDIPPVRNIAPAFSLLPFTGIASGRIHSGERSLRWQLNGSKANPHHAHRDKGALLVEVDDEPLFVDRGVVRYEDPRCMPMKSAEMHNVLTPSRDGKTAMDQTLPTQPMIPQAAGSERSFSASLDIQPAWPGIFRQYRRLVEAENPEGWTVSDKGEFLQSGFLSFHLHSPFPFLLEGGRILAGPPGRRVEIVAPWASHVAQKAELIDCNYRHIHHLQIWSGMVVNFDLRTLFRRVAAD